MSSPEPCPSCGQPRQHAAELRPDLAAAPTRSTEALLPETIAIESTRPPAEPTATHVAVEGGPIMPTIDPGSIVEPFGASESNDTFANARPDPFLDAIMGPESTIEAPIVAAVDGPEGGGAPAGGWPCLDLGSATKPAMDGAVPLDSDGSSADGPSPAANGRRSAWPAAMLASYASAMTIACLWLGWQLREARRSPTADAQFVTGVADDDPSGVREDDGAIVEPAAPIEPGLRVRVGEELRVGSLAITPMAVRSGPIRLERRQVDGDRAERRDGEDALILDLRLRNLADDAIFAPLDEAFLRDRVRTLPDSFVELADGTRIYGYGLSVRSEWSIIGQRFADLRPGEVIETAVFSEPDANSRLPDEPATWRLKLRVAPDRVETIGVEFDPADVL